MPPQEVAVLDEALVAVATVAEAVLDEHEDAELPPQEKPAPDQGTSEDPNGMGCDYCGADVGGEAKDEPRPLPFNSPFHLAKEFGIVENHRDLHGSSGAG